LSPRRRRAGTLRHHRNAAAVGRDLQREERLGIAAPDPQHALAAQPSAASPRPVGPPWAVMNARRRPGRAPPGWVGPGRESGARTASRFAARSPRGWLINRRPVQSPSAWRGRSRRPPAGPCAGKGRPLRGGARRHRRSTSEMRPHLALDLDGGMRAARRRPRRTALCRQLADLQARRRTRASGRG